MLSVVAIPLTVGGSSGFWFGLGFFIHPFMESYNPRRGEDKTVFTFDKIILEVTFPDEDSPIP